MKIYPKTEKTDKFAKLFIFMRTDLASMNTGKAIAQGSHAANAAAKDAEKNHPELYLSWAAQAAEQNFGTCIVLAAPSIEAIHELVTEIEAETLYAMKDQFDGAAFGIVHDSTYPLTDGKVVHHIPLDTCGYCLCWSGSKAADIIRASGLKLHP